MELHHHPSSQLSAHFDFDFRCMDNIDPTLDLDNKISSKGEDLLAQQNISSFNPNNPKSNIGVPIESSEVMERMKTFVVWKLFNKDNTNDRVIYKIYKGLYIPIRREEG
jgi:hypothetical protein